MLLLLVICSFFFVKKFFYVDKITFSSEKFIKNLIVEAAISIFWFMRFLITFFVILINEAMWIFIFERVQKRNHILLWTIFEHFSDHVFVTQWLVVAMSCSISYFRYRWEWCQKLIQIHKIIVIHCSRRLFRKFFLFFVFQQNLSSKLKKNFFFTIRFFSKRLDRREGCMTKKKKKHNVQHAIDEKNA